MPQGGVLAISTHLSYLDQRHLAVQAYQIPAGTYACISVSDTGHGMSKEILERVFEPFFTTKEHGKGTGLGLPMVYGFARQSGGSIRIYSEPGCGTSVLLYLPLAESIEEEFPNLPAPHPRPERPLFRSQVQYGTVLIVDDEADLIEIGIAYLTELGYTALCAANARRGP